MAQLVRTYSKTTKTNLNMMIIRILTSWWQHAVPCIVILKPLEHNIFLAAPHGSATLL